MITQNFGGLTRWVKECLPFVWKTQLNPEIPGRIQLERFKPVKIVRKKSNTFRGITIYPFFSPETTEFFCTICLDYQCQALSREKAKSLPVFCKWYNSISFLFSVPKKYQYHLTVVENGEYR